jgi:mRNA interferase HicA
MSYKRQKILRALAARGCKIIRDTGSHTVVADPSGRRAAVPRHREINGLTAQELGLDADAFVREIR